MSSGPNVYLVQMSVSEKPIVSALMVVSCAYAGKSSSRKKSGRTKAAEVLVLCINLWEQGINETRTLSVAYK